MKALGYLLYGIGLLIFWPVQIGLGLYGVFFIVKTFLNAGVVPGLISIPVVGISLGIVYLIIHVIATPYIVLVSSLLGKEKPQGNYYEIAKAYHREWEKANPEKRAELEWRHNQWYKFIEDGLNPEDANKRARALHYEFWQDMKHEKP